MANITNACCSIIKLHASRPSAPISSAGASLIFRLCLALPSSKFLVHLPHLQLAWSCLFGCLFPPLLPNLSWCLVTSGPAPTSTSTTTSAAASRSAESGSLEKVSTLLSVFFPKVEVGDTPVLLRFSTCPFAGWERLVVEVLFPVMLEPDVI